MMTQSAIEELAEGLLNVLDLGSCIDAREDGLDRATREALIDFLKPLSAEEKVALLTTRDPAGKNDSVIMRRITATMNDALFQVALKGLSPEQKYTVMDCRSEDGFNSFNILKHFQNTEMMEYVLSGLSDIQRLKIQSDKKGVVEHKKNDLTKTLQFNEDGSRTVTRTYANRPEGIQKMVMTRLPEGRQYQVDTTTRWQSKEDARKGEPVERS